MSHQAGLSGFDPPVEAPELYDHDAIAARLADTAPWWAPGSAAGYHALTQGFLQNELVRRIDGRTLGQFFAEEVAAPLGADFHIGLPASEDARIAELDPPRLGLEATPDEGTIASRTLRGTPLTGLEPRTREWREAELPAAGGFGNARSVTRIHAAVACGGVLDGVRLMSEQATRVPLQEQFLGDDLVLGLPARYGMGFGLNHPLEPRTPTDDAYFWGGWGGSVAVIDLEKRCSIAYVMNNMADDLIGDERGANIVAATYAALG